jgi:hypothetical protein
MRKFIGDSCSRVAALSTEATPPQQRPSEELRAAREAQLRAATLQYEAEQLSIFDRLPKWNTTEGGKVRHYFWNGQKWIEFDLDNPPLWAIENIDSENLAAPGPDSLPDSSQLPHNPRSK